MIKGERNFCACRNRKKRDNGDSAERPTKNKNLMPKSQVTEKVTEEPGNGEVTEEPGNGEVTVEESAPEDSTKDTE